MHPGDLPPKTQKFLALRIKSSRPATIGSYSIPGKEVQTVKNSENKQGQNCGQNQQGQNQKQTQNTTQNKK